MALGKRDSRDEESITFGIAETAQLSRVVELVRAATEADGAAIGFCDAEGFLCNASIGNAPEVGSRLQMDSGLTRACLETRQVVLCKDAANDSRVPSALARSLHLRSAVVVPIQAQDRVAGLVEVFSSRDNAFNEHHVGFLRHIAAALAPVMLEKAAHSAENLTQAEVAAAHYPDEEPTGEITQLLAFPLHPVPKAEPSDVPPSDVAPVAPAAILRRSNLKASTARARLAVAGAIVGLLVLLLFAFANRPRQTKALSATATQPGSGLTTPIAEGRGAADAHDNSGTATIENSAEPARDSSSTPAGSSPSPARPDSEASGSRELETNPTAASTSSHPLIQPAVRAPVAPESKPLEPYELSSLIASPNPNLAFTPAIPAAPAIVKAAVPQFELTRTFKAHSSWVTALGFSADGQLASGSWDRSIKFWDVGTGEKLGTITGQVKGVQALAWSRDGHWLATEDSNNTVTLWNATTQRETRTFRGSPLNASDWVYSIAFSPDGRLLATALDNKTIRIWDVETGRAVRDLPASEKHVIYIAFSPDGRRLASGKDEKTIDIWDVATGDKVSTLRGHEGTVYAVAFSPDGRWLASASRDKTVKLWDLATGREAHTLSGHRSRVTTISFSPDGRWLASGSWDKTIKIWDVVSGREVETLAGHTHDIYTVAFDARGRWLASGSEDGTMKLWRRASGGRPEQIP
jgi:WD40 repeat protein/putative methionine-R-sulfoxide reductase with GAF domain